MHDLDEDHEHPDFSAIGPDVVIEDIEGLEMFTLKSVGIDIGSSTFHLVFSQLTLRRAGASLSACFQVTERKVLFRSTIMLTPYLSGTLIDVEKVKQFIEHAYRKARLQPEEIDTGAIIIPAGEGYSVIWEEGKEKVVVPWHECSLFVPPNRWFHQHFNVGGSHARYLALHPPMQFHGHAEKAEDRAKDQIEYPDEDPFIRRKFEEELAKRGVKSLMPDEAYTNRNYEWSKAMGEAVRHSPFGMVFITVS